MASAGMRGAEAKTDSVFVILIYLLNFSFGVEGLGLRYGDWRPGDEPESRRRRPSGGERSDGFFLSSGKCRIYSNIMSLLCLQVLVSGCLSG